MNKKFIGSKSDLLKVLDLYDLKYKSIKPIKNGIINSSFFVLDQRGKKYVLRVYRNGMRTDHEILRELQITQKFRRAGIPIPQLLENLKGKLLTEFSDKNRQSWRAILMKFVNGRHLKANDYSLIPEFAALQAKMHKLERGSKTKNSLKLSFDKMVAWLKDEKNKARLKKIQKQNLIEKYEAIVQDILLEIKLNQKTIWSLPAGYVHLDYDSNNLLVGTKHIEAILDFDDLSYQPLALDSAFSLWWWLFENPIAKHESILQLYAQGYTKHRKWSRVESQLLPLFMRMRNATLAGLLFVNLPKNPNLKLLERAIKLDRVFKTIRL